MSATISTKKIDGRTREGRGSVPGTKLRETPESTWAAMYADFMGESESVAAIAHRHGVNIHAARKRTGWEMWVMHRSNLRTCESLFAPRADWGHGPDWPAEEIPGSPAWRIKTLAEGYASWLDMPLWPAYFPPDPRPDAVVLRFRNEPRDEPCDLEAPAAIIDLAQWRSSSRRPAREAFQSEPPPAA